MTKESIIQRHVGLSSDTKPANAPVGSTFYEYDTNDTYITIDSGSTWVIKDSKSTKRFPCITSISAATAYTSGDIISNSISADKAVAWVFSGVAGYNGGSGKIIGAQVYSTEDTPSATLAMYLFNGTPSCGKTDNEAACLPLPGDVTGSVYIGRLDFDSFTVWGASAESIANACASCLPMYFYTPASADDLHGILVTTTAATFTSKTLTVALLVKRD